MHWNNIFLIFLISETSRYANWDISTLLMNRRIVWFCWHNNKLLVQIFKWIQPIVYLYLYIITQSITFKYIEKILSHFYSFNIEMWTYNIKTFMSYFLPVKVLKRPPINIDFVFLCICKINQHLYHGIPILCSWIYSW